MNFWISYDNNWYLPYIPVTFTPLTTESGQSFQIAAYSLKKDNIKIKKNNNLPKLNVCQQDLIKAGYNHKRNNWTQEEDSLLLDLIKSEGKNWEEISKKMKDRNSKMCYSRYRRLSYETQKRWSSLQQKIILDCVQKNGFNWKLIAENLAGRTARQIKQHYEFCLQPNLDKSSWTLKEDLELVDLINKNGTNWRILSNEMGNRTQNQIKNRYFGRLLKISDLNQKKSTSY